MRTDKEWIEDFAARVFLVHLIDVPEGAPDWELRCMYGGELIIALTTTELMRMHPSKKMQIALVEKAHTLAPYSCKQWDAARRALCISIIQAATPARE